MKIKFLFITLFSLSTFAAVAAGDELYGDYTSERSSSATTYTNSSTTQSYSPTITNMDEYYPGMFEQELALEEQAEEYTTQSSGSEVTIVVAPSWYGTGWGMAYAPSWYYTTYGNAWYTPWYDPWYYPTFYYGWGATPYWGWRHNYIGWGVPYRHPFNRPHYAPRPGYNKPAIPKRATQLVRGSSSKKVVTTPSKSTTNSSSSSKSSSSYNGSTTSTRKPVQQTSTPSRSSSSSSSSSSTTQSTRSRVPVATKR